MQKQKYYPHTPVGYVDQTAFAHEVAMKDFRLLRRLQNAGIDTNDIQGENDKTIRVSSVATESDESVSISSQKLAKLNIQDENGDTALMQATRDHLSNWVQRLLDHNADPNICDFTGCTPLHVAAREGFLDIVVALLCSNPQDPVSKMGINIKDNTNFTALMHAAAHGHTEIVRTLLRWDAQAHSINKTGDTALTLAASAGHTKIVEILKDHSMAESKRVYPPPPRILLDKGRGKRNAVPEYNSDIHRSSATVSIRYCEIPSYLHDSDFYQSLSADEGIDSFIEIPANCYKSDDSVRDADDFHCLIQVIAFWGVLTLPTGIIQFCSENDISYWEHAVDFILAEQGGLLVVELLKNTFCHDSQCLFRAIEKEFTDAVKYLIAIGPDVIDSTIETTAAALIGRLDYIVLLEDSGFAWGVDACSAAAANGHIHCLSYLHEHGCEWDYNVYTGAALNGHVKCLQYAYHHNLPWDSDVCRIAATNGNLECLEFLHTHGCPWNSSVTTVAAHGGYVSCLRYAVERGCPISDQACATAARGGHIECLTLLHENGANWDTNAPREAAQHGRLNCLTYLHEHGCPWDESAPDAAARTGNVETLSYTLSQGCPYNETLMLEAAKCGRYSCVEHLIEVQGLYMNEDGSVFGAAFEAAHHNIVEYLVDMGYPTMNYKFSYNSLLQQHSCDEDFDSQFAKCIEYVIIHGLKIINDELVHFVYQCDLPICQALLHEEAIYEGYARRGDQEHYHSVCVQK